MLSGSTRSRMLYIALSAILSVASLMTTLKVSTLLPGLIFAIGVLLALKPTLSVRLSVLFIALSTLIWYINLMIGLTGWGLTAPIAGGLGSFAMNKILEYLLKKEYYAGEWKDIFYGVVAGAVGLIPFVILDEEFVPVDITFRLRISFFVLFWQLAVGYRILKNFTEHQIADRTGE